MLAICNLFCLFHYRKSDYCIFNRTLSNTGNIFLPGPNCRATNVALQVQVYQLISVATRATNFHIAKSRRCFYFLQRENLLRAEVVIRATNNGNFNATFVSRLKIPVCRKCCSTHCLTKYEGNDISKDDLKN